MADNSRQDVVEKTKERIRAIEETLVQVANTRFHLKRNATEVKGQIQTAMSRQLESMRSREVWLLSQVDVIESVKDKVLQQQEEQLNRALGSLHGSLNMCPTPTGQLDFKLSESIERLDHLSLHPEETPNICFRGEVAAMKEAIQKFGRVDSNGLPLETSAFADPYSKSTCLPQAFEDYEDAEHHVLYKPVAGNNNSIQVSVPRLSQPVASWLLKTPEKLQTPKEPVVFQPFVSSWRGDVANDSSTQQWLLDIQNHLEVEEENDYEIVSPRTTSECSDYTVLNDNTMEQPTFEYFKTTWDAPTSFWLVKECISTINTVCLEEWGDVLSYFQNLTRDHETWLLHSRDHQANEECCRKLSQCSNFGNSSESIDIENLDRLACVDSPNHQPENKNDGCLAVDLEDEDMEITEKSENVYNDWLRKDTGMWLRENVKSYMDEKDVDETESVVQRVCRANEPCASFSECVSDENCCALVAKNVSCSRKAEPNDKDNYVAFLDYFRDISPSGNDSKWLSSSGQPSSTDCSDQAQLFPVFDKSMVTLSWLVSHGCDSTSEKYGDLVENYFQVVNSRPNSAWLSGHTESSLGTSSNPHGNEWLHPVGKSEFMECDSDEDVNVINDKSELNPWLNSKTSCTGNDANSVVSEEEDSVWLLKKEGSSEKLNNRTEYDNMFSCFRERGTSQWIK